ncbi:hypothetical protein J1N35_037285 [Gossypium stocksii]|uniref:Uncharacterized protein n=1 Tax=Gossypium stocksii TaxID=47602 RepID=A0A9D3ZKR7_9ROSI|nr:hypothetical protein J1N35_037285 [Gossypium stocksii]
MDRSKSTPMERLVGMETGPRLREFYAIRLKIGLTVFKDLLVGVQPWILSCGRFYMD